MSVTATTCESCGRTVYLARNISGRVLNASDTARAMELLEHTYRIQGDWFTPCVGVYVDHASRCPGDVLSTPEVRR